MCGEGLAETKSCRGPGVGAGGRGEMAMLTTRQRYQERKLFPNSQNEERYLPSLPSLEQRGEGGLYLSFLNFISPVLQILTGYEKLLHKGYALTNVSFWLSSWPRRGGGNGGRERNL